MPPELIGSKTCVIVLFWVVVVCLFVWGGGLRSDIVDMIRVVVLEKETCGIMTCGMSN